MMIQPHVMPTSTANIIDLPKGMEFVGMSGQAYGFYARLRCSSGPYHQNQLLTGVLVSI